ncbi:MAG: BrnT family toxin [Deltaproteobacteria bacterium]|nr:BrnT family toxin [Deltaproteobacteria bacterium]
MSTARFEWDANKDLENRDKHGVSFAKAQYAFADPRRVIAEDLSHSGREKRYYCFGKVGGGILTVRFAYRAGVIRIFGAGYWRKGKAIYERENKIHR